VVTGDRQEFREEVRILTPAQYLKHRIEQESEMGRKRKAEIWIKSSSGLEVGPWLCEADARLAKSTLALFREDLQWSITNENEQERNHDGNGA
jgi:hypothetical protein